MIFMRYKALFFKQLMFVFVFCFAGCSITLNAMIDAIFDREWQDHAENVLDTVRPKMYFAGGAGICAGLLFTIHALQHRHDLKGMFKKLYMPKTFLYSCFGCAAAHFITGIAKNGHETRVGKFLRYELMGSEAAYLLALWVLNISLGLRAQYGVPIPAIKVIKATLCFGFLSNLCINMPVFAGVEVHNIYPRIKNKLRIRRMKKNFMTNASLVTEQCSICFYKYNEVKDSSTKPVNNEVILLPCGRHYYCQECLRTLIDKAFVETYAGSGQYICTGRSEFFKCPYCRNEFHNDDRVYYTRDQKDKKVDEILQKATLCSRMIPVVASEEEEEFVDAITHVDQTVETDARQAARNRILPDINHVDEEVETNVQREGKEADEDADLQEHPVNNIGVGAAQAQMLRNFMRNRQQ
jgi:hypothetical protein